MRLDTATLLQRPLATTQHQTARQPATATHFSWRLRCASACAATRCCHFALRLALPAASRLSERLSSLGSSSTRSPDARLSAARHASAASTSCRGCVGAGVAVVAWGLCVANLERVAEQADRAPRGCRHQHAPCPASPPPLPGAPACPALPPAPPACSAWPSWLAALHALRRRGLCRVSQTHACIA
jgi:hypothetical protein